VLFDDARTFVSSRTSNQQQRPSRIVLRRRTFSAGWGVVTVQADTWYRVLEKLRHRIGPQRFELWFKHTELVRVDSQGIEVGTPNLFVAEWLQTHFAPLATEILKEECGTDLPVRFKVSAELYKQGCQQQLAESSALVSEAAARASGLNRPPGPRPDFTLETFVVGPGSRLAHACAMEIVAHAQPRYNPLFLHSDCGLGKTHLLHAIWNVVREQEGRGVEYLSGEVFTNEFIYAMNNNRLDAFRERYRNADVLLIDDVNFFNGKNKIQEELLHTFDALHTHGSQIVLASDVHPKRLASFRENLVNRFISGMVVCIEPPDAGTRFEILGAKARRLRCRVGEEVLRYIAGESHGSVRDLEGALNSVVAYAGLCNRPPDVEMARQALRNTSGGDGRKITGLSEIEKAVAERFGITPSALRSGKRTRAVSRPRQVCIYLARRLTHLSCADIAAHFGQKHHTSVLFADRRVQERMESDPDFKAVISEVERGFRP
jgi:chromosomal replication initiator protein